MSKKIKKLKYDILHASGIYKTIEDVPKELRKGFEDKGLIIEVAPDISQTPEIKDLEAHVNDLKSLLSTETNRADENEKALSQANSDIAGLTSQLEDAGNCDELKAIADELKTYLEESGTKVTELESALEESGTKVTELEKLLKEAKKAPKQ